jgi:hypothetical protein
VTQVIVDLRLAAGLMAEAERVAEAQGTTLDRFINTAVAEKLSALRTADYLRVRAARADLEEGWAILEQSGDPDLPLQEGDELKEPEATVDGSTGSPPGPRAPE